MVDSAFLDLLRDRVDLRGIPFTDRGSRLLLFYGEDGFRVRIAERWFKRDRQLAAYRQRSPLIEAWNFTDVAGQPVETTITTYPHRIDAATPLGLFTFSFFDEETLLVGLPPARCGMTFRVRMDRGEPDRRGGVLWLTGEIRRHLAYSTNAEVLVNSVQPVDAGTHLISFVVDAREADRGVSVNISPRLGFNRRVPPVLAAIEAQATAWHTWFARAPAVEACHREQYYYAWWIMRAGLISPRYYTTREATTPSKVHYVGVWQWDALFHALAYRHVEPTLAQDQIRIVLDHQRADGMLPDAVHDEGTVTHLDYPVDSDVTKPPLAAWAAAKVNEVYPDRDFLDEIYEPLVRWTRWWLERNDIDHNGLSEYQHPFSSGLDDSPMWDDGMPVEAPDLTSYLCLQMDTLAGIATQIGEDDDAKYWTEAADALAERLLALRWDDRAGLVWPARDGEPVRVKTPFSLFPLLTGRLPDRVSSRLVAHLTNEGEFWPRFPVPTVALDDPNHNPTQMWRGPVWANVNYLLVEGLSRSGYTDVAAQLRDRTLELLEGHRDIYEYYHPLTGSVPPKAAPIFGWSAAIYIDLAIQAANEAAR
jgi:hypothetical protein